MTTVTEEASSKRKEQQHPSWLLCNAFGPRPTVFGKQEITGLPVLGGLTTQAPGPVTLRSAASPSPPLMESTAVLVTECWGHTSKSQIPSPDLLKALQ